MNTRGSVGRSRWAVMWIASNGRKRKLIRKDFGDDYAGAKALYNKAMKADKPYATLACVNMGFMPPAELRPRKVRKKGRMKGTRKIKIVEVVVDPLKELNLQGKLWCPYCCELRPFVKKRGFYHRGIWVDEPGYHCPICGVSHRDYHVRHWNRTVVYRMDALVARRTRAPRATTTTRRRRRSA